MTPWSSFSHVDYSCQVLIAACLFLPQILVQMCLVVAFLATILLVPVLHMYRHELLQGRVQVRHGCRDIVASLFQPWQCHCHGFERRCARGVGFAPHGVINAVPCGASSSSSTTTTTTSSRIVQYDWQLYPCVSLHQDLRR